MLMNQIVYSIPISIGTVKGSNPFALTLRPTENNKSFLFYLNLSQQILIPLRFNGIKTICTDMSH
jgi:hypothetical protein